MANDLRIFGGDFDDVNALRVTAQTGGQLLYVTGEGSSALLLQNKSVTPGASVQTVRPDEGYYGLSQVNVDAIPSTYLIPSGQISVTRNGVFNVAQYATANVNIIFTPNNQAKNVSPTNSQQVITADSGYDGLSSVTISAVNLQNKTVTPGLLNSNVTADAGYNGLGIVTITPNLQIKSATPTNSTQNITPDSGYSGLSGVTIQPIPNNYIDTTDATATANEIIQGKTAYVNTTKLTGTLVTRQVYEGVGAPSNDFGNIGDIYFEVG